MSELNITEWLGQGVAIFLIVAGVFWFLTRAWPYWEKRDTEERQRRFEVDLQQVSAQKDTAHATARFADALDAFTQVLIDVCASERTRNPSNNGTT